MHKIKKKQTLQVHYFQSSYIFIKDLIIKSPKRKPLIKNSNISTTWDYNIRPLQNDKRKFFLLAVVDAGMLGGALDFVDIIICDVFHLYLLSLDSYWYWQYVCACLNDFTYFSLLTNQYIDFDLFSLLCMRKSS